MTTPTQKRLTVSDRKLVLEVIEGDYKELLNQLEPQARAWYDQQVRELKNQHGDDSSTLESVARECEDVQREAQALIDAKVRDLQERGFEKHSDTQCRAYMATKWQNSGYASALRSLNEQFHRALQDGRAAIISEMNSAKRKVLMHSLQGVGEAAELIQGMPSLQDILGQYLVGAKQLEG